MTESTASVLYEVRGAVALVTLNRPQALNALNSAVLEELIAAFAAFEADPGQRCAVPQASTHRPRPRLQCRPQQARKARHRHRRESGYCL